MDSPERSHPMPSPTAVRVLGAARSTPKLRRWRVALAVGAFSLLTTTARAQPFDRWMQLAGRPSHGYVEIADHPALNPTTAFTFEAWVNVRDANNGNCSVIAG